MAYSQIRTPKFYIDYIQYLNSIGAKAHPENVEHDGLWNADNVGAQRIDAYSDDASTQSKLWGLHNYKPFEIKWSGNTSYDHYGLLISHALSTRHETTVVPESVDVPPGNYGATQLLRRCNYLAIFGHNFASQGLKFLVRIKVYDDLLGINKYVGINEGFDSESDSLSRAIYNCKSQEIIDNGVWWSPQYDGASLIELGGFKDDLYSSDGNFCSIASVDLMVQAYDQNGTSINWSAYTGENPQVSAISLGRSFDMPFAPDLKVSQSRTYETRRHETKGGKVLSKPKNIRRPFFNEAVGFDLAHKEGDLGSQSHTISPSSPNLSSTGRKSWDIKYSQIEDFYIMGVNESSSDKTIGFEGNYPNSYYDGSGIARLVSGIDDKFLYSLNSVYSHLQSTREYNIDLYSNVVHLTQGRLPFIFQTRTAATGLGFHPHSSELHICDFDQESFSNKQVASGVYETSMKIKEVW